MIREPFRFGERDYDVLEVLQPFSAEVLERGLLDEIIDREPGKHASTLSRGQNMIGTRGIISHRDRGMSELSFYLIDYSIFQPNRLNIEAIRNYSPSIPLFHYSNIPELTEFCILNSEFYKSSLTTAHFLNNTL